MTMPQINTVVLVIIFFTSILYATGIEISFNPFYIKFNTPWFGVGCLLLALAMGVFYYCGFKEGLKSGYSEALADVILYIRDGKKIINKF